MSTTASMRDTAVRLMESAGQIAVEPGDSDDQRLRKAILTNIIVLFAIPALLFYALLYSLWAEYIASALAVLGALVIAIMILILRASPERFNSIIPPALTIPFLSTFLIALALGGHINSGFVFIWGFLSCSLAILFFDLRRTLYWVGAFLLAILVCLLLQPLLRQTNNIPFFFKNVLAVLNMAGSTFLILIIFLYFVGQRNRFLDILQVERDKSDNLLLNILPEEIAAVLKDEQRIVADQFEGVSILFADVVDFTPMSAGMTPNELVELLNEVFSYFDTLAEKYDLEKIKTIGDCYMVAAGVPRPRTDHAQAITHMAVEMRDYIDANAFCGRKLAFRIGINSGPVVAGVIGRKKFTYDLWGDAVNTASRMESNGRGGHIQITRATYDLIKEEFDCQPEGTIDVKGKGQMAIWYVQQEHTD